MPTLRMADGERELQPGDSVLFRRGEAHRITNRSDQSVRFLFIAPLNHPEIIELPDTERITVFAGRATSGRGDFTLLKVVNAERVDQGSFTAEPPPS